MRHFNFEAIGMKYMMRWLRDLLGGEEAIHYVQSGDSYDYFVR